MSQDSVRNNTTHEHALEELLATYENCASELEKCRIALAEVVELKEDKKTDLVRNVDSNVQNLLLPIVKRLIEKSSSIDARYLEMLEQNLMNLTSPAGITLSSATYRLTPKEIELCNLIKNGFTVKEIAEMQKLSERTIETHRLNIRKKLGISSRKINLASYLYHLERS